MRAAFFDVDGTLTKRRVWNGLIDYFRVHRIRLGTDIVFSLYHYGLYGLHKLGLISQVAFREPWAEHLSWYFRGYSVQQADEIWDWVIRERINGFWRDDLRAVSSGLSHFESTEKYIGLSALGTDRVKNGGLGLRFVPFDASIPDENYVEFFGEMAEHWHRMEDAKAYPLLSERMQVQDPGGASSVDEGYTKNWALAIASYTPPWNEEARQEFYDWFRKYAEICWKYDGVLTSTHGYIPRALEVEMLKKELGENYYKLMQQIKDVIDPKHIMNPQTKFRF